MNRVIVIGGGIVGCHCAIELAARGYEIFLLEKNDRLGQETSSRNSGVLHAGIYYAKTSLKAGLCMEGNILSRAFFTRFNVPFRPTGKFIIARNGSEEEDLSRLCSNARENGVAVELAGGDAVRRRIPFISCRGALYSPSTGIIDVAGYIDALKSELYRLGVHLVTACTVHGIDGEGRVESSRGAMTGDVIINAAGLYADGFAKQCGLKDYEIVPLKGDYYCTRDLQLDIPVYPPPNTAHNTLGLHLTPTFGSEVLIGPSQTVSAGKDNYLIETPEELFSGAIRSMVDPAVQDGICIFEGYSGNRPRLYREGSRCDDFVIQREPGTVIHLLGIESPGLTAAPALARHVADML